MEVWNLRFLLLLLLLTAVRYSKSLEDLIAEESRRDPEARRTSLKENATEPVKKYSSKIRAIDESFGGKLSPKKTVLDFRIESDELKASAAGSGNSKSKEDDDEEKTLAQQVADGKYGLIQNEIFPHGSKRPGIISYLPNPEVPKDTKEDFGGLDKDEIWLAEDHVLVLRGGHYPSAYNETVPTPWPPIDDYVAPTRQVAIPKNPKIPPPFPIQLTENGPLEIIRGVNGSLPPRPPFFPPFPLPPPGENKTFPFPVPPGPLPPFLANLPPGAAFLPPPGNTTEIDEDDPSIYYPPKYDFYYPLDNTTAVPPGPLVPGIILPPPPNFFSPEKSEVPNDEDNETEPEDKPTKKPPYIAPAYLPSNRKPAYPRTTTSKPPGRKESSTVTYVYPVRGRLPRPTRPPPSFAPIYVPNMVLPQDQPTPTPPRPNLPPIYYPSPTPKPHHITIPKNQSLKQDIFIITTEPPESDNSIYDLFKDIRPTVGSTLDDISPERHPLRSLIKPNVSVNYIGKVGHLPPSTPFPFPRKEQTTQESYPDAGHYITFPQSVTVTPVPIIKKIKVRPPETATQGPHATFYFYEEPKATQPTPVEENEVSVSPLEQFLKENIKPEAPYEIKTLKSPVYISKPRIRYKPKPTKPPPEEPPKLNALEVDNHGFQGISVSTELPEKQHALVTVTPPNIYGPTTDGPFIPSNYYATANPAAIHFTGMDPSVVDDITMKYFTLFGQKLNTNGGTTPLTPIPPTSTPYKAPKLKVYTTTESPKSYSTITTPPKPSYFTFSTPKPPRPTSHFEQFLKEVTGEDQNDFIITHNGQSSPKVKKPKSRPGFSDNPKYFQPPNFYLPYRPPEISQYLEDIYRPPPSTTLRAVTDIHQKQQYYPQISTTYKPYVAQPQRPHKPLDHNFGQFLQEVTYSGPKRPPTSTSNLQFFDASSHSSVRQHFRPNDRQPVSLEGDILVNYQRPHPGINPDAEVLGAPYSSSNSNIRVVNAPNLTNRTPYRPGSYKTQQRRPPTYEPTKNFFENLPHSGYFGPSPSSNTANAFVSYNLPGNSGHFYFLTPQAVDRSDPEEEENAGYAVKRSYDVDPHRTPTRRRPSSTQEQRTGTADTSQDYLRRRRKKP